jgi:hypothetical protein
MFMGDMKFTTAGDFLASQESQLHYADDNIAETSGQETFNADGEYTPLIEGIRGIMPEFVEHFNGYVVDEWFPKGFRKTAKDHFNGFDMSQRSAELSKMLGVFINNNMEDFIKNSETFNMFAEERDGYDWVYRNTRDTQIEDKNCMSQAFDKFNMWTGNANSGEKVSMHLLKRFELNEDCHITGVHISLVNLEDTTTNWISGNGARSSLSFTKNDSRGIIPIMGYFHVPKRGYKLFPRCEKI